MRSCASKRRTSSVAWIGRGGLISTGVVSGRTSRSLVMSDTILLIAASGSLRIALSCGSAPGKDERATSTSSAALLASAGMTWSRAFCPRLATSRSALHRFRGAVASTARRASAERPRASRSESTASLRSMPADRSGPNRRFWDSSLSRRGSSQTTNRGASSAKLGRLPNSSKPPCVILSIACRTRPARRSRTASVERRSSLVKAAFVVVRSAA
ncbi:hypothetical protein SAMN04487925_106150 [Bradyrhizobium sp. cf659]|nr:hypothetical protein SAMN04487925_106150 [Bradyrhizobium sp. cf659]